MTATAINRTNVAVKTLTIENLQKSYGGRKVVDGVSFHVSRGEVV